MLELTVDAILVYYIKIHKTLQVGFIMQVIQNYYFDLQREVKGLSNLISSLYHVPNNIEEIVRKVFVSALNNEQSLMTAHQSGIFIEAIKDKIGNEDLGFDYAISVLGKTKLIIDLIKESEEKYLNEGLDLYLIIKTESICELYPDFEKATERDGARNLKSSPETLPGLITDNVTVTKTGRFSWYPKYQAPQSFYPSSYAKDTWDVSVYLVFQISLYAFSLRGIMLYQRLLHVLKNKDVTIETVLYDELLSSKITFY